MRNYYILIVFYDKEAQRSIQYTREFKDHLDAIDDARSYCKFIKLVERLVIKEII